MELISITNAAKEKGVSRPLIYQLLGARKLDSKEIAGKILVIKNQKYLDYQKKKF